MKILIAAVLVLSSLTTFAKTKEEVAKTKAIADYNKGICLMKNKKLAGQKLQDCINAELKRQNAEAAKNK